MIEHCRQTPEERGEDLRNIMEMSCQSPIATVQKVRVTNAFISAVLGYDKFSWLTPNFDIAVGLSKLVSLFITIVIYVNTSSTTSEYSQSQGQSEINWVGCEVERVRSVNCWQPNHAAPAQVIASTIMLNIHGCEIASFPKVKLENVNQL